MEDNIQGEPVDLNKRISDEFRDLKISEISTASNKSRHQQADYVVTVKASCLKPITWDMRHVIFGLPTASVALVFAHARGIENVDEEILEEILKEGQSLFQVCAKPSDCGRPHGSVSPIQMERPIKSFLSDVSVKLNFSPEGAFNHLPKFFGRLTRKDLFQGIMRFSKENHTGVLQVGDLYMALVFENDFLYVVNPGIGSSSEYQDLFDLPIACARLKKCHRRGWHCLVDDLILLFKLENNFNDRLEYAIICVSIENVEMNFI